MRNGKLPDILTDKEQLALLSAFNMRCPTQRRARAMVNLALQTGMRISDLVNLRFEDIDFATGLVHVKNGKGKKDRVLYIRPAMIADLVDGAAAFNREPTGLVFATRTGTAQATANLRRLITAKAKKAGIKKRVHWHLLRHTALTQLYTQTKDLRLVQEVAGHADISTTQIYTHISGEDVRAAMLGEV